MACTLLVVEGQRKVTDQEAMEYARIAGLRFIRLQHIKGAAAVEFGQRGFQTANIRVETDANGGRHYKYELSKDRFTGEDCLGQRQLLFQPDKHTGMLHADLVDTPYNRQKLVKCYFNHAQWIIVDPVVDKDIRAQAEAFQKSQPKKPSKDKVITDLSEELKAEREKSRKLEEQLKKRGELDDAIEEATTASEDDMLGALGLTEAEAKKLREEAKQDVYEEMADQIEEIRSNKGRAWASSKEYRETILPVIEARYQSKLEEKYAEHTGVGVDN